MMGIKNELATLYRGLGPWALYSAALAEWAAIGGAKPLQFLGPKDRAPDGRFAPAKTTRGGGRSGVVGREAGRSVVEEPEDMKLRSRRRNPEIPELL